MAYEQVDMGLIICDILGRLGFGMFIGTVLMVLSVVAGWIVARFRDLHPVRVVSWWLSHVVLPLLSARSWCMRTLIIFANNTLVLGTLVAVGRWHVGGRVGVIAAGLGLGIGLNLLNEHLADKSFDGQAMTSRAQRLVTIGVLLNLLEIGAIIVSLGMAVGAAELGLTRTKIWLVFGICVVPTLLVAAGGEALWLGELKNGLDHDDDADGHLDVPMEPPPPGGDGNA